jgi:hypothetical protein
MIEWTRPRSKKEADDLVIELKYKLRHASKGRLSEKLEDLHCSIKDYEHFALK